MARPRNPQRRNDLLDAAARVIERDGIAGTTLRPLAAELGVSPRTLQYHFGSKEDLLVLTLRHLRTRDTRARRAAAFPLAEGADAGDVLAVTIGLLWEEARQPVLRPFFALYFELAALAIRDPDRYRDPCCRIEHDWTDLVVARCVAYRVPTETARAVADTVVSGYRGALHLALATGRWEAADVVVETLVETARRLLAR